MWNRRRFLKSIAAAAATPALTQGCAVSNAAESGLRADPQRILDLPPEFSYRVVSRAGDRMDDGLRVPIAHDGMAAFRGDNGRIILVCNHEIGPASLANSAFGESYSEVPEDIAEKLYDRGSGRTPSGGGTTTSIYNPDTGVTEKQFLSLGGTELNCAGGPTPWGSWLSCEECFENPGRAWHWVRRITRDQRHGYVFEVPAYAEGLSKAEPIKAMGRFEHEACAVDENTGIVYMTEDRHHSLFYRYIPNTPGRLLDGGRLQALGLVGHSSVMTHNWSSGVCSAVDQLCVMTDECPTRPSACRRPPSSNRPGVFGI